MSISEPQFRDLLSRYLNETATDEERKIVDDFFASYTDEIPQEDTDGLNDKKREILLKINQRVHSQKPRIFQLKTWLKVAAAVSIIATSLFVLNRTRTSTSDAREAQTALIRTESTKRGEKLILDLPDGTKVYLNANSSISYPASFTDNRAITLRGEAYFEVSHDALHPFTVQARSSSVKVLGTVFNVKASDTEQVEVTLVTGKVNVNSPVQEISVEPGYQAIVNNQDASIRKERVNVSDFVSWKDNVLLFRETPLPEAIAIFENWFDVKIEIGSDALKTCRISGQYNDESLDNVVKSFEFLLQANAQFKDERTIILSGKGCKQ